MLELMGFLEANSWNGTHHSSDILFAQATHMPSRSGHPDGKSGKKSVTRFNTQSNCFYPAKWTENDEKNIMSFNE